MTFFANAVKASRLILFQKEVRKVNKTLLEEDQHFDGWRLGHGYVDFLSYWVMHVPLVHKCEGYCSYCVCARVYVCVYVCTCLCVHFQSYFI